MTTAGPPVRKLFCFGFGYTAEALAHSLKSSGTAIAGTRTRAPSVSGVYPIAVFDGTGHSAEAARLLAGTTHLLLSIPPTADGDLAFAHHASDLAGLITLRWIGYLSTVGVYGDAHGGTVDETSPLNPTSERAQRRVVAEDQWRTFGQAHGITTQVFRLPGIYGPGRSALDSLRAGTARRVIKPGQIFNRAHVADIAGALAAAIDLCDGAQKPPFDTYNIVDDEPAPPQDVVAYAAELLSLPVPPDIPYDAATLSPMARSFYGESKRVRNARLKAALGYRLLYPNYRDGLKAIAAAGA
jgi:nucleoside-diphosphate-sugar epimerase